MMDWSAINCRASPSAGIAGVFPAAASRPPAGKTASHPSNNRNKNLRELMAGRRGRAQSPNWKA